MCAKKYCYKLVLGLVVLLLTACTPAAPAPDPETVEVTRVVIETVEVEGEMVEATRIVEVEVLVTPIPIPEPEEEPMVILKWSGGSFYEAVNESWVIPFEEETGIDVDYQEGSLLPAQIKAMVESGNVSVDLFGTDPWSAGRLAELGLIQKINWDLMDPALLDEIPEEWRTGPIWSYGLPSLISCRVLAYRTDAFDEPPTSWADFWDQENFPGPRALWWGGYGDPSIEMALFALGYTADQMGAITHEMLDEAYAKLDELKPDVIKWTTAGAESSEMLARGEIVMADTWDGRVLAVIESGAPVAFTRNEGRCGAGMMAIPTGAPHPKNAHQLMGYMLKGESQARFQMAFAYGGINAHAAEFLPPARAEMLSTSALDLAVFVSPDFYNQPIDPDNIFGPRWSTWLAETWTAFEAAAPGEWIPTEQMP